MKTLLKENAVKGTERWYPQPISRYKFSIYWGGDYSEKNLYGSNFAYNMQYIEYLEKEVNELVLSNVICTMIYKSYIITAMGIVELLFTNLLKSTGHWSKTSWKECANIISNPKKINGVENKIETHIFEKVEEYEMRMDLDSMIKKIEKKKLLSIDHSAFPVLKKLRELRNRVHLQAGEHAYDHDYNNFGYPEITMMREILYVLLTSKELCKDRKTFQFLSKYDVTRV